MEPHTTETVMSSISTIDWVVEKMDFVKIRCREIDIARIMESLITHIYFRCTTSDTCRIHTELCIWNLEFLTISDIFCSSNMPWVTYIFTLYDILTFPYILTSCIWHCFFYILTFIKIFELLLLFWNTLFFQQREFLLVFFLWIWDIKNRTGSILESKTTIAIMTSITIQ